MNLRDFLPAGIDVDDIIALSAASVVVLVSLALWQSLLSRDPLARRIRILEERRDTARAASRVPRGHRVRGDLRHSGLTLMRRIVQFNLLRGQQAEGITRRLTRAGLRGKDALVVYLFAKASLPLLLGGSAVLLSQTPTLHVVGFCLGALCGFYGADLYVKNETDKRKQKLRKGLADALDLLLICAEAGLSLDAAITRVGAELARAYPELADEFSLTALELSFLPDRRQALQNLVDRTDLPELRSLVNSLLQAERYGTTLAQSLRVLSAEMKEERMMRAEEKAAKLPATMTVPMIMFILPALFIVIGAPAAIRILDTLGKMKM